MKIRDPLHGSITLDPLEAPLIESRYFQRLRQIHQLGFSENSFPSATHNRFTHSLGALATATQAFDAILSSVDPSRQKTQRFRAVLRLAALLHDIGHGPLSHTTEFAMPEVTQLNIPLPLLYNPTDNRPVKATHEDYTLKIILDSGLTPLIENAGKSWGFKPIHVAALIDSRIAIPDNFFIESIPEWNGQTPIDFHPLLRQLISSELDADRMDYLRRDSLYAGVSYGQFDFSWLIGNLTAAVKNNQCFLSLQHRALYTFEDFLISRFHMFSMVYFHHKSVIFDEMLSQYFASPDCDYQLPVDIEKYCDSNDAQLYEHLARSSNKWAQRITTKRPYVMLIELHSGVPTPLSARQEQEDLLQQLMKKLDQEKIHYLLSTSTSELSKYFRKPGDPIFVHYDNHYSPPSFIPLEECTDLFQRYNEKRLITRLYVSPENNALCRSKGFLKTTA